MNKTEKYFEVKVYIANNSQVICLARDISERKLALNRLQFINIHDPLTGLYNRSYFEQKLVEFDSQAFLPLGIVICDLDWLKLVNDAFGHYYGDELLKASAKIIQSSLTSMEIPCRIGGDEFAVLFPNCSQALLEKFNDRINQEIETYNYTNPKLPISFSMGSCIRMDMQTTINAVYKNADNLMYHEKLVKGYNHRNQFVQIIIKNLDNKNHLSGHLKDQIQTYVLKLANAIEYPKKQMPNIKLFIEFHDIGYISIPDEILNKKSPLKEDEWNSIKKHSEVGYKLSLSIPDLLPVADWVLKHHEWWNGQGYPLGLEGNSIPIECRMLSIVKAYLAMTHDRPYRKAMTVEEAVNELERCAGVQFDPILVDVFKNILYEEDITNEQLTIDTLTHETPTA